MSETFEISAEARRIAEQNDLFRTIISCGVAPPGCRRDVSS